MFPSLPCRCECPNGYSGKNCSVNQDDCENHICQNGADCEDGLNSYRCLCPRGYSGTWVSQIGILVAINHLKTTNKTLAGNQNIITNINNTFLRFTSKPQHKAIFYLCSYCEIAPVSPMHYPSSSVCQEHDCKNGGICFQPPGSSEYICKCAPGMLILSKLD